MKKKEKVIVKVAPPKKRYRIESTYTKKQYYAIKKNAGILNISIAEYQRLTATKATVIY